MDTTLPPQTDPVHDERSLWLLVLTTRDHPGDTAAIASVFSGRGIQIDSFIGFGSIAAAENRNQGRIMITFYAFPDRCQNLCRVLESLEAVRSVRCFDPEATGTELVSQAGSIKELLAKI
jgi:acetolactate synthase small subunit